MKRHGYEFDDKFADQENHLFAARQLSQPEPETGATNLAGARRHIDQAREYLDALRGQLGPDQYRKLYGRWVLEIEQPATA